MALGRLTPLVLVAALAVAPAAAGSPARVEQLKRLSGKTPFTGGCGVPGDETPSSEAEPHLAVDPRNPDRLVATWQQDRFAVDGGALSNLVASTGDGGRSWRTTRLPALSRCTGGSDERSSDPWVSIGPDGRVYHASLTFSETPAAPVGAAGPTALSAAYSTDGGRSFSRQTSIVDANLYDDREAVTADPTRPGHAYVAWVRRLGAFGESGVEYFSRTSDGGRRWSSPRAIQTTPPGTLPDPTLIEVLPDGTLLNLYLIANGTPILKESVPSTPLIPWEVMSTRSTDQGRTWSEPVHMGTIENPVAPRDPDSGANVRAYPVISSALGRDGTAYVVWNEIESESASRVSIVRSRDGGRTWSEPRTVASLRTQAFVPNVAVTRHGTVGVTFDDFRRDRPGDRALTTDVWFRHSHDGGRTWRETHLGGPFDMLTAPPTSSTAVAGRFVGDYQGLVGLPRGFASLFAQARPQSRAGPSDVFFGRVRVGRLPNLRVRVRPRRVRSGRRVRFHVLVTAVTDGRLGRVQDARVHFGAHKKRTNRRGRTSVVVRIRRGGPRFRRVRASKRGFRGGSARVRVQRHPR